MFSADRILKLNILELNTSKLHHKNKVKLEVEIQLNAEVLAFRDMLSVDN